MELVGERISQTIRDEVIDPNEFSSDRFNRTVHTALPNKLRVRSAERTRRAGLQCKGLIERVEGPVDWMAQLDGQQGWRRLTASTV